MITQEMLNTPCNWNRVNTAALPTGIGDCGNFYLSLRNHNSVGTDKDFCPMCGRQLGTVNHDFINFARFDEIQKNAQPLTAWNIARLRMVQS